MKRGTRPLRVGYLNVQGLTLGVWTIVQGLLQHQFDFIFLTETWYIDHLKYQQDRQVIASTERPPRKEHPRGRAKGGIYLVANHAARGRIQGTPVVQDHAITFTTEGYTISGIYLAPSLPLADVRRTLTEVERSTIVIGDINARFYTSEYQQGAPGPRERTEEIGAWMQRRQLTWQTPIQEEKWGQLILKRQLTVDHAFIAPSLRNVQLRLICNRSLGIQTDHQYTIHITIPTNALARPKGPQLPRFQVDKLQQESVQQKTTQSFQQEAGRVGQKYFRTKDVDELNTILIGICQTVSQKTLGLIGTRSKNHTQPEAPPASLVAPTAHSMTIGSHLYKKVAATSKENGLIQASLTAQAQGIDALTEIHTNLGGRYQAEGRPQGPNEAGKREEGWRIPQGPWPQVMRFTVDEVAKEIHHQDALKGCGADGIHIRLMKTLVETDFTSMLNHLFSQCLITGRTPAAWNKTEIHLLIKNGAGERTMDNLRPITLICMFRKVFERMLLQRFDEQTWAYLHPGQAGFRSHYSTCANAAVMHHLLSTRIRHTAVLLDFRSAFDVVNHNRLIQVLVNRGAPGYLIPLINSLMVHQVQSRVLVNQEVSPWFSRTQGVLQGSPLSPILFNLFIDDLVTVLNPIDQTLPTCLFYADDGSVITSRDTDTQSQLNIVYQWSVAHGLPLNVEKCRHLSQ